MNLTYIICRSLAWVSLITGIVIYFLNADFLVSRQNEVLQAQKNRDTSFAELERDENKSTNLINGLFRERGKIRLETEEAFAKADSHKEEVGLLLPKKEDLLRVKAKLTEEFKSVSSELEKDNMKLKDNRDLSMPILEEVKGFRNEVKEFEDKLKIEQTKRDSFKADLAALVKKRDVAKNSYNQERENLLQEIQKPPFIYYGDEVEILINNMAPSGRGFFISSGYENGFREDMTFLAIYKDQEKQIFLKVTSTLVQNNLSFFEFSNQLSPIESKIIQSNKKLFLIRTGESNTNGS